MRKYILLFLLFLTAIGGYFAFNYFQPKPVSQKTEAQELPAKKCFINEQELIDLFNSVRTNKVSFNKFLDESAQSRSLDGIDGHDGFRDLYQSGYYTSQFSAVGEVLTGACDSQEAFNDWKSSPAHWKAITNERYDSVGIGYGPRGVTVAIFGDLR